LIATVQTATHHVEVRGHERIRPLLGEGKRTTRETGNEDDSGFVGVPSCLCPDLGAIRRVNINGKGGSSKRKSGEK